MILFFVTSPSGCRLIKLPHHAACYVILNLLSQVGSASKALPWPKPIALLG